ncbi:hypothetical protein [Megamonas hypermegale]|uniref:hypothetical protein n=1 Tax=Megamonas hypermegale TaxID=158847 RepID=UPI00195B05F8|nr:hypothetical protein [Megamonas hypermegale]MBM6834330.1 hypothetical protein [Megamonas hypermegale]
MFMFLPLLLGAVSAGTSVAGVATTGLMAAAGTGAVGATTGLLTKAVIAGGVAGAAGATIGYNMKNKVVINNNNGTMKGKTK